jgi:tetratricopeptide (TPR) repeat protein
VWQEVRERLHPKGLEIVTVALDTGGIDAARPWIDLAEAEHPSLIDQAHLLDELLGIVNVPSGTWIDEEGLIVRPPEPAFPGKIGFRDVKLPRDLPPRLVEILREAAKIEAEPERYLAALEDWVEHGAASRFALDSDEVVARSAPRPPSVSEAAASFELGQHLQRAGNTDAAVHWFREAHRLQPDNWTYKRQAWSFLDPILQGPSEEYEGDWLGDVRAIGAENYYPPVDL